VRDTLKLTDRVRESSSQAEPRPQEGVHKRLARPYVDHGWPGLRRYQRGGSLRVKDPPPVLRVTLTIQQLLEARRRHNSLHPDLEPTNRLFLRWGESGGTGLPNPEAEVRETHYDPLPPDLQAKVDGIVEGSPWEKLTRKWYRTSLTNKELAVELNVSRRQLYYNWHSSLWYFRGRFEAERVHE
jgi:hypothetical protein